MKHELVEINGVKYARCPQCKGLNITGVCSACMCQPTPPATATCARCGRIRMGDKDCSYGPNGEPIPTFAAAELASLRAKLAEAHKALATAVAVVKDVEWHCCYAESAGMPHDECPSCLNTRRQGHAPDCAIAAFIASRLVAEAGGKQ